MLLFIFLISIFNKNIFNDNIKIFNKTINSYKILIKILNRDKIVNINNMTYKNVLFIDINNKNNNEILNIFKKLIINDLLIYINNDIKNLKSKNYLYKPLKKNINFINIIKIFNFNVNKLKYYYFKNNEYKFNKIILKLIYLYKLNSGGFKLYKYIKDANINCLNILKVFLFKNNFLNDLFDKGFSEEDLENYFLNFYIKNNKYFQKVDNFTSKKTLSSLFIKKIEKYYLCNYFIDKIFLKNLYFFQSIKYLEKDMNFFKLIKSKNPKFAFLNRIKIFLNSKYDKDIYYFYLTLIKFKFAKSKYFILLGQFKNIFINFYFYLDRCKFPFKFFLEILKPSYERFTNTQKTLNFRSSYLLFIDNFYDKNYSSLFIDNILLNIKNLFIDFKKNFQDSHLDNISNYSFMLKNYYINNEKIDCLFFVFLKDLSFISDLIIKNIFKLLIENYSGNYNFKTIDDFIKYLIDHKISKKNY